MTRGRLTASTSSSIEWAGIKFFPLPRPFTKRSTTPSCQWIGTGGAGHFVKMVHNGIEYGDMQLISEAYSLLKNRKGLDDDEMAVVFEEWNKGELDSFLIEITKNILRFRDASGEPPGITDGPCRAPSSPPEIPLPTK